MEESIKIRLKEGGVNLDAAMQRFMGKESLVEKYLNRFLTEKSYQELIEALENNDADTAARAAHTLKSVCGTLGFEKMQAQVVDMESDIRNGRMGDATGKAPELENEYARICALIQG